MSEKSSGRRGQPRAACIADAALALLLFAGGVHLIVVAQRNHAAAARETASLTARLARLDREIEATRKRAHIPGLAVVAVRGDQTLLLRGYGLRDVERGLPVTPDTLFGIGSCTKAFTAMAAVISADRGTLSLEDPPRRYLPYFRLADREANRRVTIRDLLSHRTGLKALDDAVWHQNDRLSRTAVIRAVMLRPPVVPFRREFQYNNVMYTAAGECVAKANHSSWEQVIAEQIFGPLGMSRSHTSLAAMEKDPDHAVGYTKDGKKPRRERRHDLTNVAPAGGINSTPRDMARWLHLMIGGGRIGGKRLVSEPGFQEIVSPQIPIEAGASYGLGWELGTTESGHPFVTHAGGAVGHAAHVWLSPRQQMGWAVLANINNTPPFRQVTQFVDTALLPRTHRGDFRFPTILTVICLAAALCRLRCVLRHDRSTSRL